MIDTHAHITFSQFNGEQEEVIQRAKDAGVDRIVNVGCDLVSCDQSVEMAEKHENIFATLGMHPYEAALVDGDLMDKWRKLIKGNKKIVAIGECGLDYFKANVPADVQKKAFRLQIELAVELGLPLIVHNREADEDSLKILKEYSGGGLKVVFHCFGSNAEFANKVWSAGFLTSFTGTITYPNARDLHDVVRQVPMDMFMVETDCPYLAPQKFRGQRNEPAYVVEVAKEVAKIKGVSFEEVEKATNEAANWFFGLK
jgi:TatD DNase family protein